MFENQIVALNKFKELRVAALFMEMGTGKTRAALELARQAIDDFDEVLWLAPKSTLNNLHRELDKYDPLPKPIRTIGYETLASSDRAYLQVLDRLDNRRTRLFLVCDESLYLKNGETKRWRRVNNIRQKYANYVVLLNGTPVSRDEMDIYWQMAIMSPQIIGLSESAYRNTMFTKFVNKATGQVWYKGCSKNIAWLKSRIAPYVYECDLTLPINVIEETRPIRVTEWTRELYRRNKSELLKSIADFDDALIMEYLGRMKMIAATDNAKNDEIAEMLTGMNKRCLVFCEYRAEQDRIAKMVKNGYDVINGDTSQSDRNSIIARWEQGSYPLLITYGCGAYGLNLQATDTIVMASLPWDYATYSQAIHRAYRAGQTSDVKVIKYKPRLGISNLVEECLWRKTTLADLIRDTDWESQL